MILPLCFTNDSIRSISRNGNISFSASDIISIISGSRNSSSRGSEDCISRGMDIVGCIRGEDGSGGLGSIRVHVICTV